MIPSRVRLAMLLAFIGHGFFVLTARYRLSYDAYTHMFFADHYAKDWFSLWDTRWYTGFEVVSYPPLTHQLTALLIPLVGFDAAYAIILWLVTGLFPLGIYVFSRIFTGRTASSYAALACALLLPIYVTAHIFGQLPFLAATLFALFGSAALAKFLREGRIQNFLLAISIVATTMAAHHATLLVQPFLILALAIKQLDKNTWKATLIRFLVFLIFAIPAGLVVIWPFWHWGLAQQMQTPIDHPSRHNLLADPMAQMIFFWPYYFPIGAIIPFVFLKWPRNFLGLQLAFVILFVLGLGGTTTIPALVFGKNWEWLTYDRFAFWAGLALTPFFGVLLIHLRKRTRKHIDIEIVPASLRGKLISTAVFFIFASTSLGSWFAPMLFPVQPDPLDLQPVVDFLEAEDHYYWRYLTFGFGDQFAKLSLLTKATTLDGSYHTARTVPELRNSGIGQIDTVYWAKKGIPAVGPILQASGRYGVRWGFVNRREFVAQLKTDGWVFVKYLANGIQVWENPGFTFQPAKIPDEDPFESFSWGVFPMLSLITTLSLGVVNTLEKRGERIIRGTYAFIVGLIPLSLGFWYYKTVFEFQHEQVYFVYDHALFYLSDGLAVIAVILWLSVRIRQGRFTIMLYPHPRTQQVVFALCCLITVSILWSTDWRTSAYLALHFWLVFLFILSMHDWPECWNTVILGLCALLSLQAVTGVVGFVTQSTALVEPLNMDWPGLLEASSPGAVTLKLQNGEEFLRAYGTLPHPNLLGGLLLVCLAGPIGLFLRNGRQKPPILILLGMGSSLLMLTFSRSAWLGTALFFFILLYRSKSLERNKLVTIVLVATLSFALTLLPLRDLFLTRTITLNSGTEKYSVATRVLLAGYAIDLIEKRPWTGVGAGSFIIQLAKQHGQYDYVEPVHNIPMLVTTELGVLGVLLLLTMTVLIAMKVRKITETRAIIAGALLAGLGLIGLFDHYLWTLAPGRILLGLALGLWEGQTANIEPASSHTVDAVENESLAVPPGHSLPFPWKTAARQVVSMLRGQ